MTKQQPSVTSLSPSRLCRLLLLVFSLKLLVLGIMIAEPFLPGVAGLGTDKGLEAGQAMAAEGAGAPPSLAPVLPGNAGQSPATGLPSARPGGPEGPQAPTSSLPLIAPRGSAGNGAASAPGAANATAQDGGTDMTREAFARRQEELARKEQELRVLEGEIKAKLERMRLLENRLAVMMKDAQETNDAKFRHLVDVLSNMKAKQAAAVLETLDQKIAVRVLAGMRGRQAGEILTFVKPEIAAHLAEALARMQLPLE